jgi:hypothetical protein
MIVLQLEMLQHQVMRMSISRINLSGHAFFWNASSGRNPTAAKKRNEKIKRIPPLRISKSLTQSEWNTLSSKPSSPLWKTGTSTDWLPPEVMAASVNALFSFAQNSKPNG